MKRSITTIDSGHIIKTPKLNLSNLQQVHAVVRKDGLTNNTVPARPLLTSSIKTIGTTLTGPNLNEHRAIIIKRDVPQRTVYSTTVELIEKDPLLHLGVHPTRMNVLKKIICHTANVQTLDCYLTLKKLRQNDDFALLAQYFEITEATAQQIFARSICRLSRYMRFLIRWPDEKRYYERHKNVPFAFRSSLFRVQSIVECVETEMQRMALLECSNYKFILSITPNGIITHISSAYVGHHDDLTIFKKSNFQATIPKYLQMFAVPGKAIRRKRSAKPKKPNNQYGHDSNTESADETDEEYDTVTIDEQGMPVGNQPTLNKFNATRLAGELASQQTLSVEDNLLVSHKVKDIAIPTMRVPEPVCRQQINTLLQRLREFKVLQPYAIKEPMVFQYLDEMLIVAGALTNLNR